MPGLDLGKRGARSLAAHDPERHAAGDRTIAGGVGGHEHGAIATGLQRTRTDPTGETDDVRARLRAPRELAGRPSCTDALDRDRHLRRLAEHVTEPLVALP